jgi:Cu/Ag efflux protein CusF
MNLPEFGSKLNRGCKVFAFSVALVACAACGGGSTDEANNSQVSSEVDIATTNASDAAAPTEQAEVAGTNEGGGQEAGGEVTDAGNASVGEGTGDGTVADSGTEGGEAAPAAPENKADKEKKKPAPVRRKVAVRDPFVNVMLSPNVALNEARLANMSAAQRAALKRSQMQAVKKVSKDAKKNKVVKKVVKVVKPDITVNGILKGDNGYEAMISDGHQTRLVAVGQQVDKYRVLGIDPDAKTVTIGLGKEHRFRYTLEKERFGGSK